MQYFKFKITLLRSIMDLEYKLTIDTSKLLEKNQPIQK